MEKLLNYHVLTMRFFGFGEWEQPVELYIEKSYMFGLFKKKERRVYIIDKFQDLQAQYDCWDRLIKSERIVKSIDNEK